MKPNEKRVKDRLKLTNQSIRANNFPTYCRVLKALLDSQRQYVWLRPLSDALRQKEWSKFYGLAAELSKQSYESATETFVASQFTLLVKKYPWDPSLLGFDPEGVAVKSFLTSNRRCGRINRKFDLIQEHPSSRDVFYRESGTMRNWIRSVIGSRPNYKRIFQQGDFGNGASIGVHGQATHILRKLSSEQAWSVGPGAVNHGFGVLLNNIHYLETVLEHKEGIFCVDPVRAFEAYIDRITIVDYNILSFVDKTAETKRSIAVEPTISGLVQKGIDQELRGKLLAVNIDLSDQSRNQEFARQGSLDDSEDGFVTVDIRNASNSVASAPISYVFPHQWTDLLKRTRSPNYKYNNEVRKYEMLCSMGNGFCFPIETLLFCAICVACGCGEPGVDFTVYGDDIIIRKKHAPKVLSLLKHYGFSPNYDKTFLKGPFRESCGSDWYQGEDIRPCTLDYKLDSVQNVFKFLNLTQRNERTKAFFAPVRSRITAIVPSDFRFFRPLTGDVDSAITSVGDEHLSCPHCVFNRHTAAWTWRELRSGPTPDVSRMGALRNEPWLMGVALRGSASHPFGELKGLPSVTIRRGNRTEVTRKSYASTSNWLPPQQARLFARAFIGPLLPNGRA